MRITRKQTHIILVLFATRNFMCCFAARCKAAEDINPPTCKIEDLKDKVLRNLCEKVGYIYKTKPTRKQLVYSAKLCYEIESKHYMQGIIPEASKQLDEYLADGFDDLPTSMNPIENLDNDVLIDICESIGYRHKPNPTREQLVYTAIMCVAAEEYLKGYNAKTREKRRLEVFENIEMALEKVATIVESLYLDYLKMMKDRSFVKKSRHNRISYLFSKHGIDDKDERFTLRKLFVETLEEEETELEQPTPEEIAMLPEWNPNNLPIGLQRGQMKLYRIGGQVVISRWSDQTWSEPIQFLNRLDSESVDLLKKSIQYEYTPQYPLKLKEGVYSY